MTRAEGTLAEGAEGRGDTNFLGLAISSLVAAHDPLCWVSILV